MSFQRDKLPSALDYFTGLGLSLKGPRRSQWRTTSCEFHGGSDSMRINIDKGFFQCMACGARGDVLAYEMAHSGDDFPTSAKRLGAWSDDGKIETYKPKRLSAQVKLEVVVNEISIVVMVIADVVANRTISEDDWQRFLDAVSRINHVAGDLRHV